VALEGQNSAHAIEIAVRVGGVCVFITCKRGIAGASLGAALATGGCWTNAQGEHMSLVIGVGIVKTKCEVVNAVPGRADAGAERFAATGLFAGGNGMLNGLLIGHLELQNVWADPDAGVLVEAVTYRDGRRVMKVAAWPGAPADGDAKDKQQGTEP
jgi:hypothetical protein